MNAHRAGTKHKARQKEIRRSLARYLLLHNRLLILSEYSMNSEWVKTEIAKAPQTRSEGRQAGAVSCPAGGV